MIGGIVFYITAIMSKFIVTDLIPCRYCTSMCAKQHKRILMEGWPQNSYPDISNCIRVNHQCGYIVDICQLRTDIKLACDSINSDQMTKTTKRLEQVISYHYYNYYYYYYLLIHSLRLSCHSVAVVLNLEQTKQIGVNKHKGNNTKTQYKQYKTH